MIDDVGYKKRIYKVVGFRSHPLYNTYRSMIKRCYNEKTRFFCHYGGRGITVCKEWRDDRLVFRKWALENGWQPKLQIDRIDVNGNYEPANCRFVTAKVNLANRRTTVWIDYKGRKIKLLDACEEFDVPYRLLYIRIFQEGWSVEKAITTPKKNT